MNKSPFIFLSFLIFILFSLPGCLVSENNEVPQAARIKLLNAVPENSYSFYANEVPLFSTVPFDSITPYGFAFPGFYDINISNTKNNQSIKAKQLIQSRIKYSFFIFPDSTSRANNISGFKYSIITDNDLQALRDSFYIRFMHYSPTAPTLYIENRKQRGISTIEDILPLSNFRQRTFNDISIYSNYAGFQKLPVGNYIFRLRNLNTTDSSEVLSTDRRTYYENRFYTLYLEGFLGETSGNYQLKVKIDSLLNTNN